MALEIGLTHTSALIVEEQHLAANVGSGDLRVLATPMMMALMENAAMLAVAPELEDGQSTVGGQISASHLKPTGLGQEVKATAELVKVDGRKLTFRVTASDEEGVIGEGEHLRFIVGREKFMSKVTNKLRQLIVLLSLALSLATATRSLAYDAPIQAHHDSILALISGAQHIDAQPVKSITAFGAKGDGRKDCRPAFDKAMRTATRNAKGLHLVVPAGEWFVKGPLHLTSNLTLELQEGAHLLFSPEPTDYLPVVETSWEGSFCYNLSPMIYGHGLKNVAIVGKGTIDGNCPETFPLWRKEQKPAQQRLRAQDHSEAPVAERVYGVEDKLRPHLLQLYECEDVTIEGVKITNSPFWCVHLLKCQNVICRSLHYDAKLVNNDGIDPEMTRNVLIEDIDFDNGDDNVAIKAGRDNDGWKGTPSENIIIRNCRFKGLHGLVIGSEMSAGVRNVFVEDCTVGGYCKRALYIKSNPNRGGFVHDIYFQNCHFDEVEDMFYITSMYAGEGQDDNHFTHIHDIHVDNVSARKVRNAAIVLQGTQALPIYNVSFKDFTVEEAKVGFSSMNTLDVQLRNCNIGGRVDGAPSQAK